jgi:hypothetical protein
MQNDSQLQRIYLPGGGKIRGDKRVVAGIGEIIQVSPMG